LGKSATSSVVGKYFVKLYKICVSIFGICMCAVYAAVEKEHTHRFNANFPGEP